MIIIILFLFGLALEFFYKKSRFLKFIYAIIYLFSFLSFYFDLSTFHHLSYNSTIVYGRINEIYCYSPFAEEHTVTLNLFLFIFCISAFIFGVFRRSLSPILMTTSLIYILIGLSINIFVLVQLSKHDIGILSLYISNHASGVSTEIFFPILNILISLRLIYKAIRYEIENTNTRNYKNKFLNNLNNFLAKNGRNPFWLILFSVPVFIVITLILILFGQETTSIVKVFTETATWKFSQHTFPHPIPDTSSGGHYLCTVAAVGDPKLVKPLRLGKRQGKMIVVNRQLLIANAFEDLLQDFSPKLHFIIRKNYDKYGFNISKQINSKFWSNLVYIAMKPLEWFFLFILYLCCTKPEEKINIQYAL